MKRTYKKTYKKRSWTKNTSGDKALKLINKMKRDVEKNHLSYTNWGEISPTGTVLEMLSELPSPLETPVTPNIYKRKGKEITIKQITARIALSNYNPGLSAWSSDTSNQASLARVMFYTLSGNLGEMGFTSLDNILDNTNANGLIRDDRLGQVRVLYDKTITLGFDREKKAIIMNKPVNIKLKYDDDANPGWQKKLYCAFTYLGEVSYYEANINIIWTDM